MSIAPAEAAPAVLRLEKLGKRYSPDRPAIFDGLDLELRQGEYLAIMGESGVGKSTLLIFSRDSIVRIRAECCSTAPTCRRWTTMRRRC